MSESDSDRSLSEDEDVLQGKSEDVQYIMGVAPMTVDEAASELDKILLAVKDEDFATFRLVALAMFDTKQLEVDVAKQQKAAKQQQEDSTKQQTQGTKFWAVKEDPTEPRPPKLIRVRGEIERVEVDVPYEALEDVVTKDGIVVRRLKCQLCPQIFSFKHQLVNHNRTRHGGPADKKVKMKKRKKARGPAPERNFACDQCPGRYVSESRLREHKTAVHATSPRYRCPECPATFSGLRGYKAHMMYHNKDYPVPCDHCSCRFPSVASLKAHANYYHPSEVAVSGKAASASHKAEVDTTTPQFRCPECPAKFKVMRAYKSHMMYHNNDYPYPCGHCSCRFPSLSSLKGHNRFYHDSAEAAGAKAAKSPSAVW